MKNRKRTTLLNLSLLVAMVACSGDRASLLRDNPDEASRRSEREERMALRILMENGDEYGGDGLSALTGQLRSECANDYVVDFAETSVCRTAVLTLLVDDCVAQRLAELAESERPTRFEKSFGLPTNAVLPPQLPEARITLANSAAQRAMAAMLTAADTLRYHGGQSASPLAQRLTACDAAGQTNPSQATLGELDIRTATQWRPIERDGRPYVGPMGETTITGTPLSLVAEVLAGSTATLENAIEIEAQYVSAVSEAELSRSTSPVTAAEMAWVGDEMSRVSFIKRLWGGTTNQFSGYAEGEGVGGIPMPDGDTREAIDFLRSMGTSMQEVFNLDITLDQLALGGAGVAQSFAARQAAMSGDPALTSTEEVLNRAGVTRRAVEEARHYLREEARAFAWHSSQP